MRIDGRVVLTWILERWNAKMWIELKYLEM